MVVTKSGKQWAVVLKLEYVQGRNEVAAALLAAGADVDAPDSHKMTPLHKAAVQVSSVSG